MKCAEHDKVVPHYRCAESDVWLDALDGSDGLPPPLIWQCPKGHSARETCDYCGPTLCGWSHNPNGDETCPRCARIRKQ